MIKFITLGILCVSPLTYGAECTKDQAKAAVEKACSLISSKGKDSLKEIRKFRYCGSNYVWIQDKEIKMVMHPIKPRLNGKSLAKNKDENGKLLFIEFDKTAKGNTEGGWVDYVWPKPGAEKATPKTSFVKMCGSIEWIAGSGI